jgi:hypothetical protein
VVQWHDVEPERLRRRDARVRWQRGAQAGDRQVELVRFADRYDLVVTRSEGGQTTFTMKTPGITFQDVIERIRKADPMVTDARPTVTGPIEIDGPGR